MDKYFVIFDIMGKIGGAVALARVEACEDELPAGQCTSCGFIHQPESAVDCIDLMRDVIGFLQLSRESKSPVIRRAAVRDTQSDFIERQRAREAKRQEARQRAVAQ